jgi:hypothetical protein
MLRAYGLHLTAKGYELWTTLLRPTILELAGKPTGEGKDP